MLRRPPRARARHSFSIPVAFSTFGVAFGTTPPTTAFGATTVGARPTTAFGASTPSTFGAFGCGGGGGVCGAKPTTTSAFATTGAMTWLFGQPTATTFGMQQPTTTAFGGAIGGGGVVSGVGGGAFGQAVAGLGTGNPRYAPSKVQEKSQNGQTTVTHVGMQYADKSYEQLRAEDYARNNGNGAALVGGQAPIVGGGVFGGAGATTTTSPFGGTTTAFGTMTFGGAPTTTFGATTFGQPTSPLGATGGGGVFGGGAFGVKPTTPGYGAQQPALGTNIFGGGGTSAFGTMQFGAGGLLGGVGTGVGLLQPQTLQQQQQQQQLMLQQHQQFLQQQQQMLAPTDPLRYINSLMPIGALPVVLGSAAASANDDANANALAAQQCVSMDPPLW